MKLQRGSRSNRSTPHLDRAHERCQEETVPKVLLTMGHGIRGACLGPDCGVQGPTWEQHVPPALFLEFAEFHKAEYSSNSKTESCSRDRQGTTLRLKPCGFSGHPSWSQLWLQNGLGHGHVTWLLSLPFGAAGGFSIYERHKSVWASRRAPLARSWEIIRAEMF